MIPTSTGSERRIFAGLCTGGVRKIAETPLRKNVGGVSAKMITPPQYKVNSTYEHTPLTPQGEQVCKKRVHKDAPDWKPERFAGLWSYYPAKGRKNKQRAIQAWDKLQPDDALIDRIARSLAKLKATEEWQRDVGIPYVATFLNGERWRDADELDGADGPDGGGEAVYGWQ
nr:MAG TPA: putative replisome organizer protein [Caudoviricetes sp.]